MIDIQVSVFARAQRSQFTKPNTANFTRQGLISLHDRSQLPYTEFAVQGTMRTGLLIQFDSAIEQGLRKQPYSTMGRNGMLGRMQITKEHIDFIVPETKVGQLHMQMVNPIETAGVWQIPPLGHDAFEWAPQQTYSQTRKSRVQKLATEVIKPSIEQTWGQILAKPATPVPEERQESLVDILDYAQALEIVNEGLRTRIFERRDRPDGTIFIGFRRRR